MRPSIASLHDTIGASSPFFSPDGSSLAYFSLGGHLAHVRLGRANVPRAWPTHRQIRRAAPGRTDGRIVYAPLGNVGLMEVSAGGGTPSALTVLNRDDGELEHGWPHALPDGSIVFTVSQRGRDPHVEVLSPTRQRTRLRVPIVGQAQFVETGHLVYSFLGNLMAVRFDPDKQATQGVPVAVAKGIQTSSGFGDAGTCRFLRISNRDARVASCRSRRHEKPAGAGRARWKSLAAVSACRRVADAADCRRTEGGSPSWQGPAS